MKTKEKRKFLLGSIKGRVILYVTLSSVLMIAVTALVYSLVLNSALKTSEHAALVAEIDGTSDIIDEWLVGQANIIETMKSALEDMDKEDPEAIMDFLEANLNNNDDALMYYCCFGYNGGCSSGKSFQP